MKRLMILTLALAAVVSSCSKQEVEATQDIVQVNFTAQAPQTRAAVTDLTRFVVEVHEGATATGTPTQHTEQASANFTFALKKNTAYTFLVWADYGTPDENETSYYNAAYLQLVKPTNYDNSGGLAFYGAIANHTVTAGGADLSIELGHAVAQVICHNTIPFVGDNNTLHIKYPASCNFNVADGTTISVGGPYFRVHGGIGTAGGDFVTDYIFASATGETMNVQYQFNTEVPQTITNVPFRANYTTRLKGEFSISYNATFTISSEVEQMGETNNEL